MKVSICSVLLGLLTVLGPADAGPLDEYIQGFVIADVDNDSANELVITHSGDRSVVIYDASLQQENSIRFDETPYAVLVADLDGDRLNELVVGTSDYVRIGELDSSGAYVVEWTSPDFNGSIRFANELAAGDNDGDGRNELFIGVSWFGRRMAAYEFNDTTYGQVFAHNLGSDVDNACFAGDKLVVGTSCWSDYGLRVYEGYNLVFSDLNDGYTGVAAGDVDGDDSLEIVRGVGTKGSGQSPPRPHVRVYDHDYSIVYTSPELSRNDDVRVYALAAGELLDGGGDEFAVGVHPWATETYLERIRVFQHTDSGYEEVWSRDLDRIGQDVFCLRIADLGRDGTNELYASTNYGLLVFAQHDAGAEVVLAPSWVVRVDSVVVPSAVVRNHGFSADTFSVRLRIGLDYEDTKTIALSPDEVDTVEFSPWQPSDPGRFEVKCSTMLDGDEYPLNDAKSTRISVVRPGAPGWILIDRSGPARSGRAGFVYDSDRNRLVLFGGDGGGNPSDETWEWDGERWEQVHVTGPLKRWDAAMTYDLALGDAVLFGGATTPDNYLDDTWTWDGEEWTELSVTNPAARAFCAVTYGRDRSRMVVFGGARWQTIYGETWEWDGRGWSRRSAAGPCARLWPRMAYDAKRRKCVLFGGQTHYSNNATARVLHDTWEWDGDTWILVDTVGPQARSAHTMAYDPVRECVVLCGGVDACTEPDPVRFNDTWEWDGDSWMQVSVVGPPEHSSWRMAYHDSLGRTVLYGKSGDEFQMWLYPGFEHDAAVDAILGPLDSIPFDTAVTPRAVVRNSSVDSKTFDVVFRLSSVYEDTVSVSLDPGEVDTVSFREWRVNRSGTFVVACSTMLDGDEYAGNDQKTGQLRVTGGGVEIHSITPNRGGDIGVVTIDIRGAGFDSGAVAMLTRSGQASVIDSAVEFVDSTRILAAFPIRGRQRGQCDIRIVNPRGDSGVFYDGFTIEAGRERLWIDVVGRSSIRRGRKETYWVRFGNSGNVDAYDALAVMTVPEDCPCSTMLFYPDTLRTGRHMIPEGAVTDAERRFPVWLPRLPVGHVAGFRVSVCPQAGFLPLGAEILSQTGESEFARSGGAPSEIRKSPVFQALVDSTWAAYQRSETLASTCRTSLLQLTRQDIEDRLDQAYWQFLDALFKPSLNPLDMGLIFGALVTLGLVFAGVSLPAASVIALASLGGFLMHTAHALNEGALVLRDLRRLNVNVTTSIDPNDKAGPSGFGDSGYVPGYEQFQYVVYFENVDTATAEAEDVIITDTLDPDLDWSTLEFDTSSHPVTEMQFNEQTGVITWRFEDINLPPNRVPPEGEGWLSYTIYPKENLATGVEIRNRAWIVFDVNDPMATGEWLNTIDAGPPRSEVVPLDEEQPLTKFTVKLSGADDQGGSGIRSYDVYVADNDSAYCLWTTTESTSVVFDGENGHTYKLYSVARDNVGHVEDAPGAYDAMTLVKLPTGVEVSPNPYVPSRGHEMISFFGAGVPYAEIKVFNKAGELVATLNEEQGENRLDWVPVTGSGAALASGIYIYVATEESGTVTKGKFGIIR